MVCFASVVWLYMHLGFSYINVLMLLLQNRELFNLPVNASHQYSIHILSFAVADVWNVFVKWHDIVNCGKISDFNQIGLGAFSVLLPW